MFGQLSLYIIGELFLAVALGSIVGLENEYRMLKGAKLFLGLRTSIFIVLVGFLFGFMYSIIQNNTAVLITGFVVATIFATSMYIEKSTLLRLPTATTFASTILLFIIGILVALNQYEIAIIVTVLIAALSFYKSDLLSAISKVNRSELIAIINIFIIALIILPILPNQDFGPFGIFNPFQFWLIVTIIAIIFFLQYAMLKLAKSRGLLLYSMIGSTVSSTAVTFALTKLSNKIKGGINSLVYNISFVSNIPMILIQVALIAYIVTSSNSLIIAFLPVLIASLVITIIPLIIFHKSMYLNVKVKENPLPILSAIEFGVIFFIVYAISKIIGLIAPQFLTLAIFSSSLANAIAATFSVGLLLKDGIISTNYAAFLLSLEIFAAVIEKGFIGLLSRNKRFKLYSLLTSIILGIIILIVAIISYYGI